VRAVAEHPLDRLTLVARLRAAGCVFAEEEADLLLGAAASPADLEGLVARRVAGSPLEHLLGWVLFGGRRIVVEPGVFVPRRRTELLAGLAGELIEAAGPHPVLVELCCGVGAVAALVGDRVPAVEIHAADVDPAAVRCARRNLSGPPAGSPSADVPSAGPAPVVYQGDLFGPLPAALRGRVDVLVANPPYVPTGAIASMPPEARDHEPRIALDGGSDGLDVLRRVVGQAPDWLVPGGHLLLELGTDQVPAALAAAEAAGLVAGTAEDDDLGGTALLASWPG
jgi:release factor glutamine methyltransferase